MNMNRTLLSTATLTLVALVASFAHAGDEKVYPGAMCHQEGTSSTISYDGSARVHNPTASVAAVVCPIIRDSVLDKWSSVSVTVADRHADIYSNDDDQVVCRAWSAQTDGLGWFQTQKTVGQYPNSWDSQVLTFGPQVEERDRGTFYLECFIPPRYQGLDSGVLSYRIDEP
jgi:hypothetical protein